MRGIVTAGLLGAAGIASANLATFDSMSENTFNTTLTDGGISFSALDQRLGNGATDNFVIEQADGTLSGAGFSTPNTLGFGGWSPGPGAAFSRLGEFSFSISGQGNAASFDLFDFGSGANQTLTLQAIANNAVVASSTVQLSSQFTIIHYFLSVSGVTFDRLHVVASGPDNQGCIFSLIDNVSVTPVPEPSSLAVLSLGAVAALRRRRQR